jgi:hypothetical protein
MNKDWRLCSPAGSAISNRRFSSAVIPRRPGNMFFAVVDLFRTLGIAFCRANPKLFL